MGGNGSKEREDEGPGWMGCGCLAQKSAQGKKELEGDCYSVMKVQENNQRFLSAMAEGGKADMIIGLFSTTREFDVNASDHEGNTALHKAAKNGHLLVCHILTRNGADCALRNKLGETAEDLALQHGHLPCQKFLSSSNAKPQEKTDMYKFPDFLMSPRGSRKKVSTDYITALYPYKASPDLPFDPDPRQELDMEEGEKFVLLHLRPEDGWCLVYKLSNDGRPFKEGWVPGNFMSRDGSKPLIQSEDFEVKL
ncbi:hypothetical protein GUITHDRAFT_121764 [Guillardia theta CCMP2712]|uniref:SH3 domain-containing protein n=2 Tax=Guillardia theta TaxID=55529 RepID=L1I833_GUITC|nr:hypothetical protein GUITHDRAFT_121764 [Guillardia theta CCMP2712]EKX32064.1 hypothetical protein GUITHDRAFT_121764 [Guillardia theta CCMP2712]|eukprot:XP_005819044.1 hypothetical protein GUITHDRAFT_121764 [Guillardia theta CCMP2712]